jgi:DNA-binding CsgD family transcriptional regulator
MSDFEDYFVPALFAVLTGRDLEMFQMRYGLADSPPMTLQDIGNAYGISRERVRQLLQRAQHKLRTNGYKAINREQHDRPAAQLITYLKEKLKGYGTDEIEAILGYVEDELPHLPYKTHSLPLINYLTIDQAKDAKQRLKVLIARSSARQYERRRAQRQEHKLTKLLEYVIWPKKVVIWDKSKFINRSPQRLTASYSRESFFSEKLQRDVTCASPMQHDFLLELEELDDVAYFLERPFEVHYEFDGQECTGCADIFFLLQDGRGVVVEIAQPLQMALASNLAKWTALREFCAAKGYGMIVTDGRRHIQQVQQTPVRAEVTATLMERLKSGNLTWPEYDIIRQEYHIKIHEFLAFVLINRLKWQLKPFSLSLT